MPPTVSSPEVISSPVRRTIDGHLRKLGSIPDTAWKAYWELFKDRDPLLTKSTLANVVHDLMVHVAKRVCSDSEELDYREQYHGMHVVIVEREVVVRFKKLDENLRISNVDTKVQEKIDRGETSLFGDRIEGVVTVGYMPNEIRTSCQGIYAVKHGRGGDPTWEVKIEEDEIVDYQIYDLFGITSGNEDSSRERKEHATLKLKPDVNRRDEPSKQKSES